MPGEIAGLLTALAGPARLALDILADGFRWWGILPGLFLLYYAVPAWWRLRHSRRHGMELPPPMPGLPWTDPLVATGVGQFLVFMGGMLPLVGVLEWPTPQGLLVKAVIAVTWYGITSTGWALTIQFARRLGLTRFISWGWLGACMVLAAKVNGL